MPETTPFYSLRAAIASDARVIRALIRQVQINPTGLDWQRFLLAVDAQGKVIGCGQVKPHRDGSHELASIAVLPEWRHQGVARAIILCLIQRYEEMEGQAVLYLICRAALGVFYEKFGFQVIGVADMPPYFRRIQRLASLFDRMDPGGNGLSVMKREGRLSQGLDSSHIPPAL